ncbi:MAG: hypothetical protein ABI318_05045 [Chthoniobacteraceae bacterium]
MFPRPICFAPVIAHAVAQRAIAARPDEFSQRNAGPQCDVWKGCRSKAGALK